MPLFMVDVYHGDFYGANSVPRWGALANGRALGFIGGILKCSDGIWAHEWFRKNWPAIKAAAEPRYGHDWFRGAYHFMRFDGIGGTPEQQADAYCRNVEKAGGWGAGDLLPIVDVELGSARNKNVARVDVIEKTTRYVERVKARTGRPVMLYGRGAMRDLGIKTKMGCSKVWNPSYTERMSTNGLDGTWKRDEVLLWQYTDGKVNRTTFPTECPGFGPMDNSVFLGTVTGGADMHDIEQFKKTLVKGDAPHAVIGDVVDAVTPIPGPPSGFAIAVAGIGAIAVKAVIV